MKVGMWQYSSLNYVTFILKNLNQNYCEQSYSSAFSYGAHPVYHN